MWVLVVGPRSIPIGSYPRSDNPKPYNKLDIKRIKKIHTNTSKTEFLNKYLEKDNDLSENSTRRWNRINLFTFISHSWQNWPPAVGWWGRGGMSRVTRAKIDYNSTKSRGRVKVNKAPPVEAEVGQSRAFSTHNLAAFFLLSRVLKRIK